MVLLESNEKVCVGIRVLFASELCRHFVGEVTAAEAARVRLENYFFLFDKSKNT
jgi:hypothetical protein